jgi:intein-encoded DNA endonuclease-like protein
MNIIKKRLLSKMVLNLGSVEVTIRKISHKCILEFLRKFHDSETVISVYLKTAMQQTENSHLRLKALNSLHSLLMSETKYFNHDMDAARALLEELIHSSYQKEYVDVSRAAIICLIFILKVKGAENSIKAMNGNTESELLQIRYENE